MRTNQKTLYIYEASNSCPRALSTSCGSPHLSYYLTGLIEGDGSIITQRTERDSKNRKIYPSIQICFSAKDFPLILLIQKSLPEASIHKKRGKFAYILSINSLQGLRRTVDLINGRMRSSKIYAL